jgi:hypothetical protein
MKIKVTKLYAKQDGTIVGATGIVSFYDKNNNLLHQEWFNGKVDDNESSYEREVFYSGEWTRYDSEVSPENGTFEYELLDVPEKA